MKNFKKLFASLAIVAMLASTVPTAVLGSASYSDELEGAYDYAYGIGITTQSSIDTADMYGSLIRAHMAKMMSNYAVEVLGMTPDTSKTCEFTDVANQSEEMQGYITEACQLGLMGVGITAFNPNGVVTRAQFGTVLSRALYGEAYNDGDPYYVNHLNALKDAGIMNNIDNPNANEVRGYVMLMMQRAAGADTPAVCETPENILSCSLGLDTCPAECQAVEAKEGTLTLSSMGVDYTSIPGTGDVVFGSIKFDAAGSDITVNSIKIKLQGLVSVSDLGAGARVYFEKDGVRISSRTSFNTTDKTALVSFTTPLVVKSSETIDVVLSMIGASITDIQLASTDVNSSAQTVNGSFVSPLLRTTSYGVAGVTVAAGSDYNANKTVKVDADSLITLGGLKITKSSSTDRAVIVKTITLNNTGVASLSNLEDLGLYRDDVKVSTKTTVGTRTISFVLNNEIKGTENNIEYVIKGKVTGADRITDDYSLYVRNTSDVIVNEKDTAFRTIISGAPIVAYAVIEGGDLRFNEKTVSSLTVTPGAKKVQFYSGSLTTLQAVRLDTLTGLAFTLPAGVTNLNQVLDNLYLQIGGSVISAYSLDLTAGNKINFEGEVNVDGTVPFVIYGDIKTDYTTGGSLQLTDSISSTKFVEAKYTSDDSNAGSIGSIGGRRVTISTSNLTLTNSASAATVQRGDRNIEIAKLEFATNSDIVIRLSSFALTVDAPQNFKDAQVTLYNEDGSAVASSVIRNTGANLTLDSFVLPSVLTIAKGTPVKFTVKLDQVPNTVVNGDVLTGYVKTGSMVAKDMVSNAYVYPTVTSATTALTVVSAGTPEVVSQLYTPSLVKYGSTAVELGKIDLKATNGNVIMRDAYFILSGASATEMNQINSLKLLENDQEIGTLLKDGSTIYVTNVSRTLTSTPKTYKVVANINTINNASSAITSTPKLVMVTSGGDVGYTTFESVYGSTGVTYTNVNGAKDMSSNIKFVNEVPTITAVEGYVNGGDVVYKVTLNSTKLTQLTGISLAVSPTNLSGYSTYAAAAGKVFVAANDSTYASNNYLSGVSVSSLASTTALTTDANINGSAIVYVIFKGLADLEASNAQADRKARVELTNISYADNFETGKTTNENMLTNYKAAIAGSLLLSNTITW